MDIILKTILIGIGGTLAMDIWALTLKYLFQIKSLNYAFVGRWIGHFSSGKFRHDNIISSRPVRGETFMGWLAHYLIGITFCFLLIGIWGAGWISKPTIIPALLIGIGTLIAPLFIMQPAFGFGIAASKLPDPAKARVRSFLTHCIYGVGLYLAALLLNIL